MNVAKRLLGKFESLRRSNSSFFKTYRTNLNLKSVDSRIAINHERCYCYFRIPKAANSTVLASLACVENTGIEFNEEAMQAYKDSGFVCPSKLSASGVKRLVDSYFKFTFVRDPFDRIVSAYLDKVARNSAPDHFDAVIESRIGKPRGAKYAFEEFVDYLEAGGVTDNAHWARQVDLICIPVEKLDFIGRVETLEADLFRVLKKLGSSRAEISSFRPHITSREDESSRHFEKFKDRLCEIYRVDFESLGY